MFEHDTFTRTPETEDAYIERSQKLLARHQLDTNSLWNQDPESFIVWIAAKRDTVSKRTWRLYRSALRFYFDVFGRNDLSERIAAMPIPDKQVPKRTSAKKKKTISDDHLKKLVAYMSLPNATETTTETLRFFLSSYMMGLRPSEWNGVKLIGEPKTDVILHGVSYKKGHQINLLSKKFGLTIGCEHNLDHLKSVIEAIDISKLVVNNKKVTNGRGNGPERHLLTPDFPPSDLVVLLAHCLTTRHHADSNTYSDFQKKCAQKLYSVSRKLWPKANQHISLYTARHQSIANCKKSGMPTNMIAALHGQISDRTCQEHYGKKANGYEKRARIKSPQEQIDTVRITEKLNYLDKFGTETQRSQK